MKKNYRDLLLFCLFNLLFSGYVQAEEQPLVSSFTLYDLTSERMNSSYVDNQDNTIKFITNEPTIGKAKFTYFSDIDNPLECAGEGSSGLDSPVNSKYTRFLLEGADRATVARSPYFIIELEESSTVREIQLMGKANGSIEGAEQELLYAFSTLSDATTGDFDDLPDDLQPFVFKVGDCNYNNLKVSLPSGTRSVIFISTDAFGGYGITSYANPAEITAIRFHAAPKTSTEVSDPADNAYEVNTVNRVLLANELSTISVYDLSGGLVRQASQISTLSLQDLPSGIYIVKSVSELRGQFCVKKISLIN